jgi:hypothetical protein
VCHQPIAAESYGRHDGPGSSAVAMTKRKHETSYSPSFGLVTSRQVVLAIEEFKRLDKIGDDHDRVLIAKRVTLEKWRRSRIPVEFGRICIEVDYEDAKVTKNTRANLYVSKLPSLAHEAGCGEMQALLNSYGKANGNLLRNMGGTEHLPGSDRCPDTGLRPRNPPGENPQKPRLVTEFEVKHRGLARILQYNAELFAGIPQLRASFFLKVYSRHNVSREFAALALLFQRTPGGAVVPTDAVSCGTAPMDVRALRNLPPAIAGILRALPVPPAGAQTNPWPAALNPTITVPASDIFYWRDDPATGGPVLIPGAPPDAADLQICLWSLVSAINDFDPF